MLSRSLQQLSLGRKHYVAVFAIALISASALGEEVSSDNNKHVSNDQKQQSIPALLYISTPPDIVDEMLKIAQVQKDDVLYDLGCGDGRIVVAAAKQYGCHAVGIDIDPLRVADAKQRVRENGLEQLVRIEQGDLHDVSLKDATVITLYLSTKVNTQLIPQLNQARPGGRIVSHLFGIQGHKADLSREVFSMEDHRTHGIFLWRVPLQNP